MRHVHHLNWDSDLFGFSVAKIITPVLSPDELSATLDQLRQEHVKLCYWPAEPSAREAAEQQGGFLADQKITYSCDLLKIIPPPEVAAFISPYDELEPTEDLYNLALQSGSYSRFKMDPKIPEQLFKSLYKAWMRNSTRGEQAFKVLVVRDQQKIVAMATLGQYLEAGDIGLLAVDEQYRGRGYGVALVHAAQRMFLNNHFTSSRVVTQQANRAACNLYEKAHHRVEKVEYFYHFWL